MGNTGTVHDSGRMSVPIGLSKIMEVWGTITGGGSTSYTHAGLQKTGIDQVFPVSHLLTMPALYRTHKGQDTLLKFIGYRAGYSISVRCHSKC